MPTVSPLNRTEEEERKFLETMKLAPMIRKWEDYFDRSEDVKIGANVCLPLCCACLCLLILIYICVPSQYLFPSSNFIVFSFKNPSHYSNGNNCFISIANCLL